MNVKSVTQQSCNLRNYSSSPGISLNDFLHDKGYSKNTYECFLNCVLWCSFGHHRIWCVEHKQIGLKIQRSKSVLFVSCVAALFSVDVCYTTLRK